MGRMYCHCSVKIIGRSDGRSAVSAAAYMSAEKLYDQEEGMAHDYRKKGGVVYKNILLPENAPATYTDRETLWNEVQKVESNANAQLARSVVIALPAELPREEQIEVVEEYVSKAFVSEGMCADVAIHDTGNGNPHAHILLTTRGIKENGEWDVKERKGYALDADGNRIAIIDPKTGCQKIGKNGRKMWKRETVQVNSWNDRGNVEKWREAWADTCNKHLDPERRMDHRSYERQGIDMIPTIHEGWMAREIERKGGKSELCEANREIRKRNGEFMEKLQQLADEARQLLEDAIGKASAHSPVSVKVMDWIVENLRNLEEALKLNKTVQSPKEKPPVVAIRKPAPRKKGPRL